MTMTTPRTSWVSTRRSVRANVALWRLERERSGEGRELHRERGPESFDLMFRMLAGHDRVHLDQARRALAAVRP